METHLGEDKGAFFMEDLNLKDIQIQSDTHDFWTRIYPIGADGMTIEGVNDGVPYVENHEYSDKVIAMYWEDNRYTIAQNMKDDALEKLETYAFPSKSYACQVIELAKVKGIDIQDFNIGDMIYLMSKTAEVKQKLRIISLTRYLEEPEKTQCTLSSQLSNLVDYVSESLDASEVVSLVTTSDGKIDPSKVTVDIDNLEGGVPKGGSKGEALVKASDNDYEVAWKLISGSGGMSFEELSEYIQLGTNDIQDGAITNAKIGVAAINTANIADAAINTAHIQDAAITNGKILNGAITSAKIGAAEINGAHIKDGAIDSAKIADAAITTAKIENGAITNAHLGEAIIDTANIKDGSITNAHLKDAIIDSAKIKDGSITSAKIADAAIDTANIKDGSITTAKIGEAAITSANIQDASITSAKILELDAAVIRSGTIATERLMISGYDEEHNMKSIILTINEVAGSTQLSTETIDGSAITDRTLTNENIMAGTLTGTEISGNTITGNHITSGAITSDKIAAGAITAEKISAKSLSLNVLEDAAISTIVNTANQYTDEQIQAQLGKYLTFDSETGLTLGAVESDFYIELGNEELSFMKGTEKVAYINKDEFNITNGVIKDHLQLGNYLFIPDNDTGDLKIVWKEII
jgi:uncharacterized protein YjbI with pentapeptide repeats